MILTASKLRENVYRVLDHVLETGEPAEIERNGRRLRIVADDRPSRLDRLVRRNDDTVRAVLVNGRVAWRGGIPAADLGTAKHYGQFLPLGG